MRLTRPAARPPARLPAHPRRTAHRRTARASLILSLTLVTPAASHPSQNTTPVHAASAQFDIASTNAGGTYRILIHVPEGKMPPQGYPVLYVTDGNWLCPLATAISDTLSKNLADRPAIICVGYPTDDDAVINARRLHDFTDKARDIPPTLQWESLDSSGGADAFGKFIQYEVRPTVEKRLPTDPTRTALFGHSLGGRFTLSLYLHHPDWFTAFIAGSPALWWNRPDLDNALKKLAINEQATQNRRMPPLLMETGSLEQQPGEEPVVNVNAYKMLDNFRSWTDEVAAIHLAGIHMHIIDNEIHTSARAPELDHAIRFAFPHTDP